MTFLFGVIKASVQHRSLQLQVLDPVYDCDVVEHHGCKFASKHPSVAQRTVTILDLHQILTYRNAYDFADEGVEPCQGLTKLYKSSTTATYFIVQDYL